MSNTVCYIVPTTAAIIAHRARLDRSLTLLLAGGATFGIVDHLWNGELFLIGPNPIQDLLLGFTITAVIAGVWAVLNYLGAAQKNSSKTNA